MIEIGSLLYVFIDFNAGSATLTGASKNTLEMVEGIGPKVLEIIEPPREGYQLTLKPNFSRISRSKGWYLFSSLLY